MGRAIAMLSVMVTMLLLASGVALAVNQIDCSTSIDSSGICSGTTKADSIVGTDNNDNVRALAGNDLVNGALGDDLIYGGRGSDTLSGFGGVDEVAGGDGNDAINVRDAETDITVPTTLLEIGSGEAGSDTIYAEDGNQDVILCGAGKKDVVTFDQYDLFLNDSGGFSDFSNSPSPDCEKATLLTR